MKTLLLILLMALLLMPVQATEDDPFCDAIAVIFSDWEVVPEWSKEAAARNELPDDLRMVSFIYLNNPDQEDQDVRAMHFEYSPSHGEMYLFAYESLLYTENGERHYLCNSEVRKFSLVQP